MALVLKAEKVMVKDLTDRIVSAESQITQNATEISTRVTVTTFNALENRVGTAESTIVQNANSITSRVSGIEGDVTTLQQTSSSITASINATTHTLTSSGYTLKDSAGSALITPNGTANEQNIGRVDNIENGYPMKIPFHIGSEVSQITQAKLKWDISKFRTYSKGAKSGGGSTSGSGGSTTQTVGVFDWTQGLAASTSTATITSSNLGQPHYHTTLTSNLSHRHRVTVPSHTHTTPNHSHDPEFGILEQDTSDNVFTVWVDGVQRASLNAQRGEVDLSSWVTTSGWHVIEVRTSTLKRIDANLFLKTYNRR